MQSQSNLKKKLLNLLKVVVSVGGLGFIFYKVPFAKVSSHWTEQALPWIGLILICTVFSMAIQANRWRCLLLDEGKKVPFRIFTVTSPWAISSTTCFPADLAGMP